MPWIMDPFNIKHTRTHTHSRTHIYIIAFLSIFVDCHQFKFNGRFWYFDKHFSIFAWTILNSFTFSCDIRMVSIQKFHNSNVFSISLIHLIARTLYAEWCELTVRFGTPFRLMAMNDEYMNLNVTLLSHRNSNLNQSLLFTSFFFAFLLALQLYVRPIKMTTFHFYGHGK